MGASSSTNVAKAETSMINSAYNSCGNVVASNEADFKHINFDPSPGCKTSEFVIKQGAAIDSKCLIDSLQQQAAQSASKLGAKSQAGLGFAVSTNVSDTKQKFASYLTNKCQNLSSSNKAKLEDIKVKACNMILVQDASANSACQINAAQEAISKIAQEETADAQGATLAGLLFGGGAFLIIIIIAVVAFMMLKGKMKK